MCGVIRTPGIVHSGCSVGSGSTLPLSGHLSGSSAELTKDGGGTFVLTADNSGVNGHAAYSGPITVANAFTKSQAGNVTFNDNVTTGIATISSGQVTVGASSTFAATSRVDLNGGTMTVNGTLTDVKISALPSGYHTYRVTPISTVEEGAEAVLNLAVAPALAGRSGLYFNGLREARADRQAYDAQARARLRALSLELTGVRAPA